MANKFYCTNVSSLQYFKTTRTASFFITNIHVQARSQPVFSGKPEGPFCLSCTFIFRNERNWMKKSARVSEKLVNPGLPGFRAEERMGVETSHCPSETCDARKPPKILRRKHGQCQTVVSLATV